MKIGFLASDYPPVLGGISRYSEDVARFLARRWPVQVFLCDPGAQVPELPDHPPVEPISYDRSARSAGALARVLRQRGVTHVLFNFVEMAGPFLVAGLRLRGFHTSVLLYGADVGVTRPPRSRLRLWASLLLHSERVAISAGTRDTLRGRFPGTDAHLVRPGIAVPSSDNTARSPGEGILAVGRFVRRKGFDMLLEALVILRDAGFRPPATLVGDGPDADMLRNRIADRGLGDQVRILGGLSDEAVQRELQKHRVFCLLPRRMSDGNIEGFGIVFLEAARAGLPSVAGRSGGVPDAVADGESGFLVDPESPGEIADRLKRLLTDDALWMRMSAASRKWAGRFDWKARDPAAEFSYLPAPDRGAQKTARHRPDRH